MRERVVVKPNPNHWQLLPSQCARTWLASLTVFGSELNQLEGNAFVLGKPTRACRWDVKMRIRVLASPIADKLLSSSCACTWHGVFDSLDRFDFEVDIVLLLVSVWAFGRDMQMREKVLVSPLHVIS
jgi:hypothetical protein